MKLNNIKVKRESEQRELEGRMALMDQYNDMVSGVLSNLHSAVVGQGQPHISSDVRDITRWVMPCGEVYLNVLGSFSRWRFRQEIEVVLLGSPENGVHRFEVRKHASHPFENGTQWASSTTHTNGTTQTDLETALLEVMQSPYPIPHN